ncbi:hypothetical protein NDU88_000604 [Pleurodeles waltl]|uniref:Uncharacterized protein n=1 Tax=Pleurodeles waltl TaxID=8319 RepID=A0AAV7SX29_PLEWA|nr:hypothetical protein NDU88_000604 [Pleurodeles waltl]
MRRLPDQRVSGGERAARGGESLGRESVEESGQLVRRLMERRVSGGERQWVEETHGAKSQRRRPGSEWRRLTEQRVSGGERAVSGGDSRSRESVEESGQ